ncbi:RsiV family protein [Nocardia huaxiensis]|uniref:DUF3298 domain-containing protein n=1 Tax=Nocardia huaxiensis TaxID=2755382 RepID=A0A7D6VA84_9NOCA|nr:RsiV family protein [Nocardia huaxiensis]QLY30151.1 DUF3298 domain-containing protein [Nocardia huaxiensis]UFS96236.1 RsiV family protein [Nocardia huaxiensis]
MTRKAAHYLIAALLAVLAVSAGRVIAHATPAPGEFYETTYTLEGADYKVQVPNVGIDGVDGAYYWARQDFNAAMNGYAEAFIGYAGDGYTVNTSVNYLYLGHHVLSGKIGVSVFQQQAAHPWEEFATHNTNTLTGEAITLSTLFSDLDGALQLLSSHANEELTWMFGADGYSRDAVSADAVNFDKWAVSDDGIRLYLGEVASHAAGNVVLTLAWKNFGSVLNPEMKDVVGA